MSKQSAVLANIAEPATPRLAVHADPDLHTRDDQASRRILVRLAGIVDDDPTASLDIALSPDDCRAEVIP